MNRFIVQAGKGLPLSVYGKGGQTRGFINIEDTVRCIELAALNPPESGEFKIYNQITEQFSVLELANIVKEVAKKYFDIEAEIEHMENPRVEKEEHLNFLKPHIWNYLRELHNSASINLVTSKAMYKLLEENGIQGLRVLPIGVDVINRHKKFYSEEMRDKLTGGEKDKKLLIFVGRLAPEKEIESLKELMDSREDVRLAIIGDGPSREDLEKLFKGTNTIFTGFLKGEELSQAYATGDALIFPSQSETLGLVITEAMASKTPVIAAFSEPTIEQIKDRENGFIYQRNSLASLNSCIDSLDDKELLNKIKEKGREFAENLSWEKASKAMVDAYYEALENSKDN